MVKDRFSKAIQALTFLIPVVLEGSRMKVTDDAGDVDISALEDLPRQGRPEVGLLTIPESLVLYQPATAICDKPQSPVLLLATEDVDETYVLYGLVVNMKITTPSSGDDSTRQSQFVLLLPIQVNVIRGPCLGDKGRSRRRSLNEKARRFPAWRAGTTGGATITFSSMSVGLRRAAGGASTSHDPRVSARKSYGTPKHKIES